MRSRRSRHRSYSLHFFTPVAALASAATLASAAAFTVAVGCSLTVIGLFAEPVEELAAEIAEKFTGKDCCQSWATWLGFE